MGSTPERNLVGEAKEKELLKLYGPYGFDYVGNSFADLQVWRSVRQAIVCNAPVNVLLEARRIANVVHVIPPPGAQNYPQVI